MNADAPPLSTDDALSVSIPLPPHGDLPSSFAELGSSREWWLARPAGSRLVGVVVARDDMPSVVQQRDELAAFGVPIAGFRHPAPETLETWEQRLSRLFGRLNRHDVVVVATPRALGRDSTEETRTIAELQRRGIIVKVLEHAKKAPAVHTGEKPAE